MKNENELREIWKREEDVAHIKGWDFSYLDGRMKEDDSLPWNYGDVIRQYLKDDMKMMDFDTGGGEFLLSLGHPFKNTAATEGWEPNVKLCSEKLLPLGIDFKPCVDESNIPFEDGAFDICINRHGSYDPKEQHRLLKPEGLFITQQVGERNDRELVEMVLPGTPPVVSHHNMADQCRAFQEAGFEIIKSDEAFRPIRFYDAGALVWFARVIVWEFPDFSVDRCFDRLLEVNEAIEKNGYVEGTVHRFLIVAKRV